jgi:misacylated tRNA(Ala) deacylase
VEGLTMTHLIYQNDSYIKEFSAEVSAIDADQHAVMLNQTAFYPGGGGQPYDTGQLKVADTLLPVVRMQKKGGDVWHYLASDVKLPEIGAQLTGIIDWERRYQLMRTHTAMHILCGVIFRDYGAQVTGGDMEPLKGRMDFEFESLQKEFIEVIERAINVEVEKAHPVRVSILPREEAFTIPDLIRTKINLLPEGITEVRTVELIGLDLQADGGTHVANTSEVGKLRVTDYKSKGKINKRIYVEIEP